MRKINRRDFLKAAGILAAASALTACGGSDSSSAAAGSGAAETAASLPAINEIKLGEDFQDVTADIKILTNRTDIVDTVYAGYAEQFHQLYPQHHRHLRGPDRLRGEPHPAHHDRRVGRHLLHPHQRLQGRPRQLLCPAGGYGHPRAHLQLHRRQGL